MRSRISVGLVVLCLGLAGCGVVQKSKNDNSGKPFKGLPSTQDPTPGPEGKTIGTETGLPTRVDGVLAGQVVNKSNNRRLNHAHIQVVDLQTPRANEASLSAETDPEGFFYIRGLQKGGHYRLIAKVREDGRFLAGALVASPPNAKVCIMVTDDPSVAGDSFPDPSPLPGQAPISPSSPPGGPAAVLEPPVRPSATIAPPENAAPRATGAPQPPIDPSHVADGSANGGFQKAPVANVPVPNSLAPEGTIPPPPQYPPAPPVQTQPLSSAPNLGAGILTRNLDDATPVPSCVLIGRRLDNMALYTLDGRTWEFKRNRKGRLVLLDFWGTWCPHCLRAIPYLCDLQGQFGPYGLEVIGVAYENGSLSEQAQKVRSARGRMIMNYQTLLGGPKGQCPVQNQFQIQQFPTLILLDESGTVVWRCDQGMSPEKLRELNQEIRKRLNMQMPNMP